MTIQTNEKKIVHELIRSDYPHLATHEKDIVDLVRKTFSYIGQVVWHDGKVLVKNFGTFEYLRRTMRKRFDSGLRATVMTEPTTKIKFTQSRNVFETDADKADENV